MSDFREANEEEAKQVWGEVAAWWKASGWRWRDAAFAAQTAVAEFVANSKGLTLYEAKPGK